MFILDTILSVIYIIFFTDKMGNDRVGPQCVCGTNALILTEYAKRWGKRDNGGFFICRPTTYMKQCQMKKIRIYQLQHTKIICVTFTCNSRLSTRDININQEVNWSSSKTTTLPIFLSLATRSSRSLVEGHVMARKVPRPRAECTN
jgi:hypothetical protein